MYWFVLRRIPPTFAIKPSLEICYSTKLRCLKFAEHAQTWEVEFWGDVNGRSTLNILTTVTSVHAFMWPRWLFSPPSFRWLAQSAYVCLCIFHSFVVALLSHLLLVRKIQTCETAHAHALLGKKKKKNGFSRNQAWAQDSPAKQTDCW